MVVQAVGAGTGSWGAGALDPAGGRLLAATEITRHLCRCLCFLPPQRLAGGQRGAHERPVCRRCYLRLRGVAHQLASPTHPPHPGSQPPGGLAAAAPPGWQQRAGWATLPTLGSPPGVGAGPPTLANPPGGGMRLLPMHGLPAVPSPASGSHMCAPAVCESGACRCCEGCR